MKKFLFLFAFVLLFSNYGISQEASKPKWIENREYHSELFPRDTFFFFYSFVNTISSDDYLKQLEVLNIALKQGLASHINTNVKTEYKIQSNQIKLNDSETSVSSASKNSQILVDVDLPETELKTWPEEYLKSEKRIYGILAVKKSKLLSSLISSVSVLIYNIDRELASSPQSKSNNDLVNIINNCKIKIEEVVNKITLIKAIDNNFDENRFFEPLKNISIRLDDYSSFLSTKEYEDMYNRAKKLLDENNCNQAFNQYKILDRLNSSDERVIRDKQSALTCINQTLMLNAAQFTSKNNYIKAISVYDSLIMLNPENSKLYEDDRKKSIDNYFLQTFNLIEVYLQSNLSEAKSILEGIQVFGTSEYNSKIDEYRVQINSLFYKHRTLEFRNAINHKKFSEANQLISIIGKENTTTPDIKRKLILMGKKLNKATYSYEKTKLLSSRPNLYCLNFGFTLGSQYINWNEIAEIGKTKSFENVIYPTFSQLISTYSFSIYRKININTKFSKALRDKSKSNLIGLKLEYNDINNFILVNPPYYQGANFNKFNFQISTMFYKCINFNYGINSVYVNKFDFSKDLFITTIGLKLPFYYFNLDFDLNYLSDYRSKNLFNIKSTISYKLNFKKRFSRDDRNFVKLKSQNWRQL
jgi:hypothetical protein